VGLTIGTAVLFGIVGWIDVSSIYHTVHSDPAVIAKQASPAGYRPSKLAN
jgi:hypothetical protein